MNNKAYILVFDRDDDLDYKEIHASFTQLKGVLSWSHYIKSSYIFITKESSATVLSERIREIFDKKRFFLVQINLNNKNGMLPKEAWEWLNKQRNLLK